jgi:hypothetical protein
MGNACGCSEDIKIGESKGTIHGVSEAGAVQFKQPNYQTKVNPTAFASLPEADKNEMLSEAFNILLATVELERVQTNNIHIKKLLAKESGVATNSAGETYTGEFVNGVANGRGKTSSPANGEEFEGVMFNGKPHGQGKLSELKPAGVSGLVKYINGIASGKSVFNANSKANFKKVSEGGFNASGAKSGPYVSQGHAGDIAYEMLSNNQRNGPFIVIANDKSTIALTEFKEGQEQEPLKFYTLANSSGQNGNPATQSQLNQKPQTTTQTQPQPSSR